MPDRPIFLGTKGGPALRGAARACRAPTRSNSSSSGRRSCSRATPPISRRFAAFARGADLLVHEAMYGPAIAALARRNPNAAPLLAHLTASHTLVEDAAKIAALAGVKTLVLNHLMPSDDATLIDADWIAAARPHYAGEIIVARDLMEMVLG